MMANPGSAYARNFGELVYSERLIGSLQPRLPDLARHPS